MSDPKCARMLVEAAQRDVLTLRSMTAGAPEESFGFHVQQAAEKAFKAWLAFDSVAGPQPGGTVQRRKNAYGDNRVRLADFRATRDGGVSDHELNRFVAGFLGRPHPTVWREMQRQHERIQELRDLFRDVPEALLWR